MSKQNRNNKGKKSHPANEAQRRLLQARYGKSFDEGQRKKGGPNRPKPKVVVPQGGDFHNPYNFIRGTNTMSARSSHRPHKHYGGLSGVIHIKADVLTPLMIGGQRSSDQPGKHNTVEFYEENGRRVIPSTSLKGMIRSAFEAVTNSCFLNFDPNNYEGYRKRPPMDPPIEIGIIRKMPTEKDSGEIEFGTKFSIPHHLLRQAGLKEYINNPDKKPLPISCRIKKISDTHIVCDEISTNPTKLPEKNAFLKTSGRMRKKESETGFIPNGEKIPFTLKDKQRYISCMAHGDHPELKTGDIVYLQRKGNELLSVGFAQIYKLPYENSIVDKMTDAQKPCTCNANGEQKLCPACQVFGNIVKKIDPKTGKPLKTFAFAGRVYISNGEIKGEHVENSIPLQILGSPHTSCVGFYLDGKSLEKGYDSSDARIRGRKVYIHHKPSYVYSENPVKGIYHENKMNVSVKGLLKNGEITFNVRFDSLTSEELGALLYVLNCPDGHALKLGMGKPLGLGSIRTAVTSMDLFDLETRYKSLENDGKSVVSTDKLDSYIEPFRLKQAEIEKQEFNKTIKKEVYAAYEKNIRLLHEMTQNQGAKLIISTVPSNRQASINADQLNETPPWIVYQKMAGDACNRRDYELCEHYSDLAIDSSPFPNRASGFTNRIVMMLASELRIPLADVEGALTEKSERKVFFDDGYFRDHCHLTEEGNVILINTFVDTIKRNKLV